MGGGSALAMDEKLPHFAIGKSAKFLKGEWKRELREPAHRRGN
jgi:hypothetical protein